jgi:hypothetical protein
MMTPTPVLPPYLQLQYLPTEVIDPATGTRIDVADASALQLYRVAEEWYQAMLRHQQRLRETRASIARRDAPCQGAA